MKIITYLNASLIRFVSLDEFLPERTALMMPYAQAIARRYSFSSIGESQAAATGGVVSPAFTSGSFVFEGKQVPILSLDFTINRITVSCTTSKQSEALMADLIVFLVKEFSFREPSRDVRNFVASSIVVDFGKKFFEQIKAISDILNDLNSSVSKEGFKSEMSIQGLRFSGALEVGKSEKVAVHYALEERANRPFGTSWMFSQAPLGTDEHESFLIQIEERISGKYGE